MVLAGAGVREQPEQGRVGEQPLVKLEVEVDEARRDAGRTGSIRTGRRLPVVLGLMRGRLPVVTEPTAATRPVVPVSVTVEAAPGSAGCAFYGEVLKELMRLLVGGDGMVEHVRCAGRGEGRCEWRADWKRASRA